MHLTRTHTHAHQQQHHHHTEGKPLKKEQELHRRSSHAFVRGSSSSRRGSRGK